MATAPLTHNQKIALETLSNGKTFSFTTPAEVKRARSQLAKRGLAVKDATGAYTLTPKGKEIGKEYRHYGWKPEIAEFALEVEATHRKIGQLYQGIVAHLEETGMHIFVPSKG